MLREITVPVRGTYRLYRHPYPDSGLPWGSELQTLLRACTGTRIPSNSLQPERPMQLAPLAVLSVKGPQPVCGAEEHRLQCRRSCFASQHAGLFNSLFYAAALHCIAVLLTETDRMTPWARNNRAPATEPLLCYGLLCCSSRQHNFEQQHTSVHVACTPIRSWQHTPLVLSSGEHCTGDRCSPLSAAR